MENEKERVARRQQKKREQEKFVIVGKMSKKSEFSSSYCLSSLLFIIVRTSFSLALTAAGTNESKICL
jgi:hypothetical protein